MDKNDKEDFAVKMCERLRDMDKNREKYVMDGPRAIVPLLLDSLTCIERLMLETVTLADERDKWKKQCEQARVLLREWWNSSRLSCGDGSFLAWYDSFQPRVALALADEPPSEPENKLKK